jgi:hypothetical protein
MQSRSDRRLAGFKENGLKVVKFAFIGICCLVFTGCAGTFWGNFAALFKAEGEPADRVISGGYEQVALGRTSAAEVLALMYLPDYELLSQSRSVIAVSGQKKKGYKNWLRMAAFDEDSLTVTRKYLVVIDERPKALFVEPWAGLRFSCEAALSDELLGEPYSNENARRLAILEQVLETLRSDIAQVGLDNRTADTCGMLAGQALETVLAQLKASPVLAGRLDAGDGLWFEHPNLDKGMVKVDFGDEAVKLSMKAGSLVKRRVELTDEGMKLRKTGQ